MTTPLPELLAQVPSLNTPDLPFTYAVDGDAIVGHWDIVHAQYLELSQAGTIDKEYSIRVEFNPGKGTFDYEDTKQESASSVTVEEGKISFGGQKSMFKGKTAGKSFSFRAGGVYNSADGVSPVLTYEFETKRIKEPLFAFLEGHGWKQKKGFLGGLFG